MRDINQIVKLVQENERKTIQNLNYESISVYKFLQEQFESSDVSKNFLFQFVYRSFYRIDNAGLTDEFKTEYFKIMQDKRQSDYLDPEDIVMKLYWFKRRKGDNSVQFSFTTKLINTLDVDYPIYDSEVAKVFKFSTYNIPNVQKKISRYLEQHSIITSTYKKILENNLLESTVELFNQKFAGNQLSPTKKLDFIIWSCGKVI